MCNHTLSSFHANSTSMKNKMMGKAFPLLPKTNLFLPGRPQISGSNKKVFNWVEFLCKKLMLFGPAGKCNSPSHRGTTFSLLNWVPFSQHWKGKKYSN